MSETLTLTLPPSLSETVTVELAESLGATALSINGGAELGWTHKQSRFAIRELFRLATVGQRAERDGVPVQFNYTLHPDQYAPTLVDALLDAVNSYMGIRFAPSHLRHGEDEAWEALKAAYNALRPRVPSPKYPTDSHGYEWRIGREGEPVWSKAYHEWQPCHGDAIEPGWIAPDFNGPPPDHNGAPPTEAKQTDRGVSVPTEGRRHTGSSAGGAGSTPADPIPPTDARGNVLRRAHVGEWLWTDTGGWYQCKCEPWPRDRWTAPGRDKPELPPVSCDYDGGVAARLNAEIAARPRLAEAGDVGKQRWWWWFRCNCWRLTYEGGVVNQDVESGLIISDSPTCPTSPPPAELIAESQRRRNRPVAPPQAATDASGALTRCRPSPAQQAEMPGACMSNGVTPTEIARCEDFGGSRFVSTDFTHFKPEMAAALLAWLPSAIAWMRAAREASP